MTVSLQSTPQPAVSQTPSNPPAPAPSTPPSQPPSGGTSPAPAPHQICSEPRLVPVHDEQLGLCYDVTVPCGGSTDQAVARFRRFQQARDLSRNVGVRIHENTNPTPRPSTPSSNNDNSSDVILGVLEFIIGLTPFGLAGCSGTPNTVPEIPDASPPPPNSDPTCGSRRSYIEDNDPLHDIRSPEAAGDGGVPTSASARVLAELQRQYPGIELPTLNVTFEGHTIWTDSAGQAVREIRTGDPVSFVRVDNRLYVLTANRVGEAYAPATLLVYDVSAAPPRPVTTNDIATLASGGPSNAIVLGYYNPAAMAPMVGMSEIDILFGAPNGGVVATVDPFTNAIIESDWCSNHDVDAGTSSDASMDVQSDASVDAPDASTDGSRDASDAESGRDADASDAGRDGSAG